VLSARLRMARHTFSPTFILAGDPSEEIKDVGIKIFKKWGYYE